MSTHNDKQIEEIKTLLEEISNSKADVSEWKDDPTVTFTFRLNRDDDTIKSMLKASEYWTALWDIKQYVRGLYNGKNFEIEEYFKTIIEDIKKDGKKKDSDKDFYPDTPLEAKVASRMTDKIAQDILDIFENSSYSDEDFA